MVIRWIVAWLAAALIFAGLDAVWLISTNATLYRPVLGPVLAAQVRPIPAVLFYLVYLTGTVVLAVGPALAARNWRRASLNGALFGFFAYATYDLTNFATLAVWSTRITLLDLAWGTFLTAAGATAGYLGGAWASRRSQD